MWNDVVIGGGEQGNSAVLVRSLSNGCYISQNRVSYWISGCFLGLGMTIFKNTEEGVYLSGLLSAPAENDEIEEYLNGLVVRHASVEQLRAAIESAVELAFENGRNHQAGLMRDALRL